MCVIVWRALHSVIHGFEALDAMERVPVAGKKHKPTSDIKVEHITIHANPLAKS